MFVRVENRIQKTKMRDNTVLLYSRLVPSAVKLNVSVYLHACSV